MIGAMMRKKNIRASFGLDLVPIPLSVGVFLERPPLSYLTTLRRNRKNQIGN